MSLLVSYSGCFMCDFYLYLFCKRESVKLEGSNFVDVNFKIDPRTNRVVMMGAMDNLVKGAAGQAIQNMNIMFGLPENQGLKLVPMFP